MSGGTERYEVRNQICSQYTFPDIILKKYIFGMVNISSNAEALQSWVIYETFQSGCIEENPRLNFKSWIKRIRLKIFCSQFRSFLILNGISDMQSIRLIACLPVLQYRTFSKSMWLSISALEFQGSIWQYQSWYQP